MRVYLVKLDETEYWCEDIQKVAGKLYGVYAYNPKKHVHCCELAPSYELVFVGTTTENFVDDTINEMIMENDEVGEVRYFHVSYIDQIKKPNKRSIAGFESLEDAQEYARGNAIF